ncbi:hypothetical protein SUGI_1148610 [Cryptomeria japonica]|uniref:protein JINGUBANG n=1 Tax=Cryptomeria japonica TaxID=3369 RepID=UPI002414A652|nr:protein JINGUBANG [Cryptomeria japonica]GLJ53815.1 hypothetical protein SUGI_1148610 [Cryptomeria japonica]
MAALSKLPETEILTESDGEGVTDFTDSSTGHSRSSSSCGSVTLSEVSNESVVLEGEKKRFNRCVATLSGHVGIVSCVTTSGDLLLSASQAHDVRVWRHPDLHHCARFGAGDGAVKAIVALGDRVVTAHQDQKIRVWKRSNGKYKLVTAMPTVKECLISAVRQSNYVQTRRHHRRLWMEHVDTISCLAVGVAVGKPRRGIKRTSNGSIVKESKGKAYDVLYSGSWDRTFKLWRLSDFKCLDSTRAHNDAINALAVGPTGHLFTASADCKVKVWCKPRGSKSHRLVATLEGHQASVNALALAADRTVIYSGGSDRTIVAWQTEIGASPFAMACEMRGQHGGPILCLCTVGEFLCSGSADKTVRVWRREGFPHGSFEHSQVAVLKGQQGPVKCIAGSTDVAAGFLVYAGSVDGSVKVWWVSNDKEDDEKGSISHVYSA